MTTRILCALFVARSMLLLALLAGRSTPILYHDGAGYLLAAKYLAGLGAGAGLTTPTIHFGYSIALIPAWWLGSTFEEVYRYALASNALLSSTIIFPLYILARRVLGCRRKMALWLAFATSLYPPLVLNARLVWAENLLPMAWCVFLVCAGRAWSRPEYRQLISMAVVAAATYAIHPRGLIAIIASIGIATALAVTGRCTARVQTIFVVALATATGGVLLAERAITSAVWQFGSSRAGAHVLDKISAPLLVAWNGLGIIGQAWYLLTASLFLVVPGLVSLVQCARGHSQAAASRCSCLIACGGLLLAFVVSLSFTGGNERLDTLVYGRYTEAFLPVVLMAGLWTLARGGRRLRYVGVTSAAITTFVGLVLVDQLETPRPAGNLQPLTVLGLMPYGHEPSTLLVGKITLLAGLLGVALFFLASHWPRFAIAWCALLALFGVWRVDKELIRPLEWYLQSRFLIDDALALIPPHLAKLSYDLDSRVPEAMNAYLLSLNRWQIETYRSSTDRPRSDLVISTREHPPVSDDRPPVLLALEAEHDQALWGLGGPVLDLFLELETTIRFEAEDLPSGWSDSSRLTTHDPEASAGRLRRVQNRDLFVEREHDFVVYGPYIFALPGRYRVCFRGSFEAPGASLEVTADGGRTKLASKQLGTTAEVDPELEFELASAVDDLEVRFHFRGGEAAIDIVEITRRPPT